ncbi:hypothetical protein CIPAW_07G101100 [Carya illinoinensis]|uniref:Uncharacterized protein n=1 Tax=Carya illinoinensis TaxID=32201 RepID=A0A8T1PT98_CARIL|nr:hypothetical protein CIPAW_07G101100 [Carya illinoinensis]
MCSHLSLSLSLFLSATTQCLPLLRHFAAVSR